jgi:hypothetical protein
VGLANVFSGLTGGYTGNDLQWTRLFCGNRGSRVWACTLFALSLTVWWKERCVCNWLQSVMSSLYCIYLRVQ